MNSISLFDRHCRPLSPGRNASQEISLVEPQSPDVDETNCHVEEVYTDPARSGAAKKRKKVAACFSRIKAKGQRGVCLRVFGGMSVLEPWADRKSSSTCEIRTTSPDFSSATHGRADPQHMVLWLIRP